MNFHTLFLVIGLVTIGGTLISLRREHIRTEYSVNWLVVGSVLTLLALFPGTLDKAARSIDLDPRLFFLIAGGALVSGLVFEISHVVSRLRDENVILAQRLAILEYQFQRTNDRHGQNSQ
jgi:hypothetical protein